MTSPDHGEGAHHPAPEDELPFGPTNRLPELTPYYTRTKADDPFSVISDSWTALVSSSSSALSRDGRGFFLFFYA